jgi:hypothetical protein
MDAESKEEEIARLHVERGVGKYAAILPRPVVAFFGDSLKRQLLCDNGDGLFDMLLGSDAPPRAPAPDVEPPLLDEVKESMLGDLGLTPDQIRQVRKGFASGIIERAAESLDFFFHLRLAYLEEQLGEEAFDMILKMSERAGIRAAYHTRPVGADREACERAVNRWVDLSFVAFFADIIAALAKPGDLQSRRHFLPAVRAFRRATQRLLPGDRAIFTTYHRDDKGFVRVAAVRKVTRDEERARFEAFLERLAAAIEEPAQEAPRPATLAEVQEELAWLAEWVGRPKKRVVH